MEVNESNNIKVCTNTDTCGRKAYYMISACSILCGLTSGLKQLNLYLYERPSELMFRLSIALVNESGVKGG